METKTMATEEVAKSSLRISGNTSDTATDTSYFGAMDDYVSYITKFTEKRVYDLGRAGTSTVNLYSGKLWHAWNDLLPDVSARNMSISHIYTGNPDESGVFGKYFTLSCNVSLLGNGVSYDFRDGEGYKHPLGLREEFVYYKQENETLVECDENSSGIVVSVQKGYDAVNPHVRFEKRNYISESRSVFIIYGEKGDCLCFEGAYAQDGNTYYYPTEMLDQSGNKYLFEHDTANRLAKIKRVERTYDSTTGNVTSETPKDAVALTYNTNGRLAEMTDEKGRKTTYTYDANGYLTQVAFPDGQMIQLSYTEYGLLSRVVLNGATALEFAYVSPDGNNTVCKVTRKMCKAKLVDSAPMATEVVLAEENLACEGRRATVTDRAGNKAVYRMTYKGQPTLIYSPPEREKADLFELRRYEKQSGHDEQGEYPFDRVIFRASGAPLTYDKNGVTTSANLLPANADFDNASVGAIEFGGWSVDRIQQGHGISTEETLGNVGKSYKVRGQNYCASTLTRSISLAGKTLPFSGLAFVAHAKVSGTVYLYEDFSIQIYADGRSDTAHFSGEAGEWMTAVACIPIDPQNPPSSVTVTMRYGKTGGTCYFDDLRVLSVPCTLQTETDYEDGERTVTVLGTSRACKRSVVQQDDRFTAEQLFGEYSELLRTTVTDRDGVEYVTEYAYDDKHRPIRSIDHHGIETCITYDVFGNATKVTRHAGNDSTQFYRELAEYSADGRLKTKVHDQRSEKYAKIFTEYRYDDNGMPIATVDPIGCETGIICDENGIPDSMRKEIGGETIAINYDYTDGVLTDCGFSKIKSSSYKFTFDGVGRQLATYLDGQPLETRTYDDTVPAFRKETVEKPDSYRITLTYDKKGNPIRVQRKLDKNALTIKTAEITYDELGNVMGLLDNLEEVEYTYKYNERGELARVSKADGTLVETNAYDAYGRIVSHSDRRASQEASYTYQYMSPVDDRPVQISSQMGGVLATESFAYDAFGRPTQRTKAAGSVNFKDTYSYLKVPTTELSELVGMPVDAAILTDYIQKHVITVDGTETAYEYTYDKRGNIATVSVNRIVQEQYAYDAFNRLVRADCRLLGKSFTYVYDLYGNMTERRSYAFTTGELSDSVETDSFIYANDASYLRDRLMIYNGKANAYDVEGRPTVYRCGVQMEWQDSRLIQYGALHFGYKADGTRFRKGNIRYVTNGSQILEEKDTVSGETQTYVYDSKGVAGLIDHDGARYYYIRNLLGDVTALVNTSGTVVVCYAYDPWGKCTVLLDATDSLLSIRNPFRYRGYYYDQETDLYYLQNRYYDPETGRFISPDKTKYLDPTSITGLNLYTYCGNNPVMYSDPSGNSAILIGLIIGAVIGAAIGFGTVAYTDYQDDEQVFNGSVEWYQYVGGTITGAALGAGVGGIIGAGGAVLTSAVLSVSNKFITDLFAYTLTGTSFGTWEDYAVAFISGGLTKNLGTNLILKTMFDVVARPFINQVVKNATNRQDSFNAEKYAFDVVTRTLTTFAPAPWKAFYRGGFRSFWDLYKKGFFSQFE